MISFHISDMTCGHCVSTITRALQSADPDARIRIDLTAQRVEVESTVAGADALAQLIKDAGYTPVLAT